MESFNETTEQAHASGEHASCASGCGGDGPTETVELTSALLRAALNMTSSPDHYTEKTRRFVTALHKGDFTGSSANRWKVELDEEGMETLIYILGVYCLNRPQYATRFHNYLAKSSELYQKVHARQALAASE